MLARVCLAHLERLAPQVLAIELQQIEGNEERPRGRGYDA